MIKATSIMGSADHRASLKGFILAASLLLASCADNPDIVVVGGPNGGNVYESPCPGLRLCPADIDYLTIEATNRLLTNGRIFRNPEDVPEGGYVTLIGKARNFSDDPNLDVAYAQESIRSRLENSFAIKPTKSARGAWQYELQATIQSRRVANGNRIQVGYKMNIYLSSRKTAPNEDRVEFGPYTSELTKEAR